MSTIKKQTLSLSLLLAFFTSFVNGATTTYDLSAGERDLRVRGETEKDFLGSPSAQEAKGIFIADVNGDGYGDLICGAPDYGSNGRVYIAFGATSFSGANYNLYGSGKPDVVIEGSSSTDEVGSMIASGDINGDGIEDLILGTYRADRNSLNQTGGALVFYGTTSWSSSIDLSSTTADVEIYGSENLEQVGKSVDVGDINGDGYDDIVLGAPRTSPDPDGLGARNYAGAVYAIYGGTSLASTINLATTSADIEIYGHYSGTSTSRIGDVVWVGDVTGDSYDDIFFGYYHADHSTWSNPGHSGMIWGVYGSASPSSTYDIKNSDHDFVTYGSTTGTYGVGYRGDIGDVNNDGYEDLLIYCSDSPTTSIDVIFGSSSPTSGGIEVIRDVTIQVGTNTGMGGVACGDFNGDGVKDIFTGNPFSSPGGRFWAGAGYIFYGSTSLSGTLTQTSDCDVEIQGDTDGDYCGFQVAMGDVNGDGTDDAFLSAPNADPPSRSNGGEAYLIFGETPSTAATVNMSTGSGNTPPINFGTSNVTIDFNDTSAGSGTVSCEINPSSPSGSGLPTSVMPVWWDISTTKTGTINSTSLTFQYTDAQLGSLDESSLIVYTRETSSDAWTTLSGTINTSANTITVSTDHFSEWGIGEEDEPLAVELNSFEARQIKNGIELNWETQSETENKGFRLLRAVGNPENFVKIADFESHSELVGQGNKASRTNYSFVNLEVNFGEMYFYKLVDVDFEGTETEHEAVEIEFLISSENSVSKLEYQLAQNFPNPFNPNTKIGFTIQRDNFVTLKIYNLKGQLIKTLVETDLAKGSHQISWNGADENGNSVASGNYIYEIVSGTFRQAKKMTYLK
ncbi:MAG: T9SS C-terminal target domain-containing protein [Calditrichaeota bacterium]|nr:MAG: T9SS C-terminal target domain-containing protein [Calditrichota bacterium]